MTIPEEVKEKFKIKAGDKLLLYEENEPMLKKHK